MKKAIVSLAGGSGTRLWPLSTNSNPKQLLKLLSDKTLLRETYERLAKKFSNEEIYISLNINHYTEATREIPELPPTHFITESCKMDTTAAIGLIAATLYQEDPQTMIYVAQCDHYIPHPEELFKVQDTAFATLEKHPDKILVIGTNPTYPETAYGYIEMGEPVDRVNNEIIFSLESFKEKPDKKTAKKFISSWKYLWNLGNYAFIASTMLEEYKKLVPKTFDALMKVIHEEDPKTREVIFKTCDKISIDYGISEKSERILVIPGELTWIDIANWHVVYEVTGQKQNKNVIAEIDSEQNLVISEKKVALLGVKGLAVIETKDAILVCALDKAKELKTLVEALPDELK